MELAERKKRILGAIVETYIITGEPVGSKTLAKVTGMGLSSATIRNEMSDLAELGYLEQPHTSAGRVPSQKGYRFYIDRLMAKRSVTEDERRDIDAILDIRAGDIESILGEAGKILAGITGFTALSTVSGHTGTDIKMVEFIPAGRRTALIIVITGSGVIKNRLCRAGDDITSDMAVFLTRLVNEKLAGKPLETVTAETISEMVSELYEYTCALKPLLEALGEEINELFRSEVFLDGEENLLDQPGLDSGKLHDIFSMLEQRDGLMGLLKGVDNGVLVRIGTENGIKLMVDSSVIAAPYAFNGSAYGAVGVIGPKRMDYAKIIPSLEYFSSVLSKLINNVLDTF